MSKTLETRIQYKYDTLSNWENSTDIIPLQGELLVCVNNDKVMLKVGDGQTHPAELPYFFWNENSGGGGSGTAVPVPSTSSSLTYNGQPQQPQWINYDSTKMVMGGSTTAVNAGSYVTTFSLKSGYMWSDGTKMSKNITWSIQKAEPTLKLALSQIDLTSYANSEFVTVEYNGDGRLTCSSSNTDYTTAILTNMGLQLIPGLLCGTADIVVTASEGINYLGATTSISVTNKVGKGVNLNDLTWEDISNISSSGNAKNYFNIGDYKFIDVDTTDVQVTMAGIHTPISVFIIGFDHDGATNTIDFCCFKANIQNELVDAALCGVRYNELLNSSAVDFCMNIDNTSANESTNIQGWGGSLMRTKILGSDSNPNYAPGGSFMAGLPLDMRAVMKPMIIYSDNMGGVNDPSLRSSSTIDYLPLLSLYETGLSNSSSYDDTSKQSVYEYYKDGNSRVRYDPIQTDSTAVMWWTRSTYRDSTTSFCSINETGEVEDNKANRALGCAPIFRV